MFLSTLKVNGIIKIGMNMERSNFARINKHSNSDQFCLEVVN